MYAHRHAHTHIHTQFVEALSPDDGVNVCGAKVKVFTFALQGIYGHRAATHTHIHTQFVKALRLDDSVNVAVDA